jgi:hypothetical protein
MENKLKKLLGAIVVATAIFGAVFASASNLPVQGGTIQAGGLVGLACQPAASPITVAYTTQIQGDGLDHVTGVILKGIDAACMNKWADVSLMPNPPFAGGVPWIASGWGTITTTDQTFPLQVGGNVNLYPLASAVYDVQVAIRDAS